MALLRDATTWPIWQHEIRSAEGPSALEDGDIVTGTAEMLGFGVNGHSTVTGVAPDRFSEDAIVGVLMRIEFSVEEASEGAVITHHLAAYLPTGALGRVLSWFLRRRLVRMQRATLEQLARQAEASSS